MPASALVTTAGSALANAYVDLATADQYHADRPPASGNAWASATTDQKTAAILWATRLMDAMWQWIGYPVDAVQALLWPRGAMLKLNGWEYVPLTQIPPELQRATAEYARQLLASDRMADSDVETQGIKSLSAGPVSLSFKDDVYAKNVPDAVFNLIPTHWGCPRTRGQGVRELQRS